MWYGLHWSLRERIIKPDIENLFTSHQNKSSDSEHTDTRLLLILIRKNIYISPMKSVRETWNVLQADNNLSV